MAGCCCPHREGTGVAGGCPSPSLPSHSDAADLVVQGKGTFEELMVCSREIAASTAQLVAASKVGARHLGRLLCCCLHHLAAPPPPPALGSGRDALSLSRKQEGCSPGHGLG